MPADTQPNVTTENDKVQRVVKMLTELRGLAGSDSVYVFSKYFKPISISIPTPFGALANFPSWESFSEEKIKGFKAIVNEYPDLLTGYVRIGTGVYQAGEEHDYKTLPNGQARELIKALVSRAVRVGRFDLSMMDPSWLKTIDSHREAVAAHPEHAMKEAEGEEPEGEEFNDADQAILVAIEHLKQNFGDVEVDPAQIPEMKDMLGDAQLPLWVEFTPNQDGIQITGQNNIGVCLFNNGGKLYWEF